MGVSPLRGGNPGQRGKRIWLKCLWITAHTLYPSKTYADHPSIRREINCDRLRSIDSKTDLTAMTEKKMGTGHGQRQSIPGIL